MPPTRSPFGAYLKAAFAGPRLESEGEGSAWPFPSPSGRPASLRATLYRRPVSAGQRRALERGREVTFGTPWLRATFPRGDEHPALPADLDVAGAWTLTGDDTLTPVT